MSKIKVFLDTDVFISGCLSDKGAASLLIYNLEVEKYLSDWSVAEVTEVAKRLNIEEVRLQKILSFCRVLKCDFNKNYFEFTLDPKDSLIVGGASCADVSFLVTYNIRHYKIELIKRELGIMVMTPGTLLQYFRSISK